MGEGHAAFGRHIALGKDALLAAAALYQGEEEGVVCVDECVTTL